MIGALLVLVLGAYPTPEMLVERCTPTGKHGGTKGYCPTVKMGEAEYFQFVGEGDVIVLERFPVLAGQGDIRVAQWPRRLVLQPYRLTDEGIALRVVKFVGGGWQLPPGADAVGPRTKQTEAARPAVRLIPQVVDHRIIAFGVVAAAALASRAVRWWKHREPGGNRKVRSPCPGCPVCEQEAA